MQILGRVQSFDLAEGSAGTDPEREPPGPPHITLDGNQVGGLKAELKSSLQLASSTLSFSPKRKLREVKVMQQGRPWLDLKEALRLRTG